MCDGQLLLRGGFDHLRNLDDIAGFIGGEREAERRGVGDHVEHAAIGDIDRHGAESADFDLGIEMCGESRDVAKGYLADLAVMHLGIHRDQAGGRFQFEMGDRLGGLHHPGFDQDGDHADGIGAGHRRVLHLLHDDEKPASASGWLEGSTRLQLEAG